MTPFDLLFLGCLLAAVATLLAAVAALARRRRQRAATLLARLGVGTALYFGAVVGVSLGSTVRERAVGEEQCSDDWCFALVRADRSPTDSADRVGLTFRLRSRAGRVVQRERYVVAYLRDVAGHRYRSERRDDDVPFDVPLRPLETRSVSRLFLVPRETRDLALVVAREGAGRFPRCCIIGDEGSLLHKPVVTWIR